MVCAYIGLGANLDNPAEQLSSAVAAIDALPQSSIQAISSVYSSPPMGPRDQPDYLNAVLALNTLLTPRDLLASLQAIEDAQGRQRGERWGPRTLDLDILLYGDEVIAETLLQIPHPGLQLRDFVLQPLLEIAGEKLVLPGGEELGTLAADCGEGTLQRTSQTLDINRHRDRETRA
ncbi:MAG: 2-amino-4-hydroxy-6-hydroxymethyldihydropteridine diphosphokinase [Halieaceae bacterium]